MAGLRDLKISRRYALMSWKRQQLALFHRMGRPANTEAIEG